MKRVEVAEGIFTIPAVLSASECAAMMADVESRGFEAAAINTQHGMEIDRDVRNNDRVIVDDAALAGNLWARVRPAIPVFLAGRQARGLNERFRYYRYAPGQQFSWHTDGAFRRSNGEVSLLTFMVYLNDDYDGGETQFASRVVKGQAGMALVFNHGLNHQGTAVTEGVKYVLRSDVIYGPVGQLAG
jgi:predicted 2-oxoglutarate/Fe(II)-dependent dioxygenase YbiX